MSLAILDCFDRNGACRRKSIPSNLLRVGLSDMKKRDIKKEKKRRREAEGVGGITL